MVNRRIPNNVLPRDIGYLSEKIDLSSMDSLFLTGLIFIVTILISFKNYFLKLPFIYMVFACITFSIITQITSVFNRNFHRKGEAIAMIILGFGLMGLLYIGQSQVISFWFKIIVWIIVFLLVVFVTALVHQLIESWFKVNTPMHYKRWKDKQKTKRGIFSK
ncbi:MAG: hypothetical protein KJ561_02245 [Nanoarchaeota archaeon]|nr:hypothetical protein [Nanoarchaeota archaeon]